MATQRADSARLTQRTADLERELEAQRRQLLAQAGGADWERGRNPDKTALAQSYAQREREVALGL